MGQALVYVRIVLLSVSEGNNVILELQGGSEQHAV